MNKWKQSLCSCCSNFSMFSLAFCLPCIAEGINVDEFGKNGLLYGSGYLCMSCIMGAYFRTQIRKKYQINGNCCADCCTHFCCYSCAITQEYAQIQDENHTLNMDR